MILDHIAGLITVSERQCLFTAHHYFAEEDFFKRIFRTVIMVQRKADELIAALPADVKVRFIDFHAEVTSEKMAMGWYVDGRVSALVGTHTHIPTADTRILPGGTGYQTDCGMTGPYDSVIGVEKDPVLQKFLTAMPIKMEAAKGKAELHSVIVEVDDSTGKALSIRRHTVKGD